MDRRSLSSLTAVAALVAAGGIARAQAKGPAFDCAKARGEAEQLVCRDEGLAALDRKLDEVYKAALAKARDDVPQLIRTEQRGWVKGRDECWKAKDGAYLTASWQATSVRECVEGSYRIRISELQATMRLVPPKGPVFFACEGNPANEIVATFFETDPPTARLERGDRTVTAWLVPAGTGSKYEGQNVEFWTKGKEATVTWLQEKLQCVSKSAASGAPALEELRNATYSGLEDVAGPVTLKDGRWEGPPFEPGGASRPAVSLAPGFRVTGDLDGDGAEEAAVVLAQSLGGSGTFNYVAVVKRTPEGLRNLATRALGDRVDIRFARVEGGKLLVSVVRAGEGDAMCCPGELADLAWTLSGGRLEPAASAGVTGRLSLDALAGTEWVLRSWSTDEPAPPEPEVTLAYREGRFTGTSGCNRYNAAAKAGDQPGDLSVGPSAGTMMACPDPQSAVEARFLKQLAGATKYGFWLGRLAITHSKEGGSIGVMLFEGRQPTAKP